MLLLACPVSCAYVVIIKTGLQFTSSNKTMDLFRVKMIANMQYWSMFWLNFNTLFIWIIKLSSSSVQSLSRVWLFETPWTTARQASLSITNSRSLPKFMSIKSVMPSSHLILCYLLLLLSPIPPSIRVFSNESTLRIRWPKDWSISFKFSPSNEHPGLIYFMMD